MPKPAPGPKSGKGPTPRPKDATPPARSSAQTPAPQPSPNPPSLDGEHVVVHDPKDATRLYQKGFVGQPLPGNALRLTLVEAAWLCSQGRLDVPGGASGLLQRGAARGNRTEVAFLAYSDLRARGLVVRHDDAGDGAGLQVWPRGQGPPSSPDTLVQVAAESDPVDASVLAAAAAEAGLLAVVDEDGAVTHYRVEEEAPRGEVGLQDLPAARGTLLADRVLVADAEAARAYAEREFLGTMTPAGLVLSLTEAAALEARGVLQVARVANKADAVLLRVHQALREAGVVVKSGFRFGTHLRGYAGDPEEGHALWLVQCLRSGESLHWSELSRAVRLAHGVKKRLLVALPGPPVRFIALSWFKP